jgi:hypothetical protein
MLDTDQMILKFHHLNSDTFIVDITKVFDRTSIK